MMKDIQNLTEQQVDILIHQGTERPFTGKLLNENRVGIKVLIDIIKSR